MNRAERKLKKAREQEVELEKQVKRNPQGLVFKRELEKVRQRIAELSKRLDKHL